MDFLAIVITLAVLAIIGWVFHKAFGSNSAEETDLFLGESSKRHPTAPTQVPAE